MVVVGAARSGIAVAELLARQGALVTLTEARDGFDGADRLRAGGVHLELGGHQRGTLAAADLVVVSPGVSVEQPVFEAARERGVEIVGELELASRWILGRVLAVTGTKGKSTTTTLLGRMLTAAGRRVLVGGNIGVPLSAQVAASTAETLHVVETSSFQLETTTTFRPWVAVWLNFADDHLDRHPSIKRWVRNERLGWTIPYRHDGMPRNYEPDFVAVAVLADGRELNIVIEVKGLVRETDDDKQRWTNQYWLPAVNAHPEFGKAGPWAYLYIDQQPNETYVINAVSGVVASAN